MELCLHAERPAAERRAVQGVGSPGKTMLIWALAEVPHGTEVATTSHWPVVMVDGRRRAVAQVPFGATVAVTPVLTVELGNPGVGTFTNLRPIWVPALPLPETVMVSPGLALLSLSTTPVGV